MNINIYAEDLTHNIQAETTHARDGKEYVALRFQLRQPYQRSSATRTRNSSHTLTLWSTRDNEGTSSMNVRELAALLRSAIRLLNAKAPKMRADNKKRTPNRVDDIGR
jgi:hypothetical protein